MQKVSAGGIAVVLGAVLWTCFYSFWGYRADTEKEIFKASYSTGMSVTATETTAWKYIEKDAFAVKELASLFKKLRSNLDQERETRRNARRFHTRDIVLAIFGGFMLGVGLDECYRRLEGPRAKEGV